MGSLTAARRNDVLALATNEFVDLDWQVWLVPAVDTPESRPQRLDWNLDPTLLPGYFVGDAPALSWVGASGDVDGDGRDEAIWVMPRIDLEHCAILVIGSVPGSATIGMRTTVELDEPCVRADLILADADNDGRIDVALLTGSTRGAARKLLVLWNEGEGRFSNASLARLNPDADSPEAFTFLPPIPGRTSAFAYVTATSMAMVKGEGRRQFGAPHVLANITQGRRPIAID